MNTLEAANKAIDNAGGVAELARKFVENDPSLDFMKMQYRISKWRINGVPPKSVLQVEKFGNISRHKLAPDLYPKEKPAA